MKQKNSDFPLRIHYRNSHLDNISSLYIWAWGLWSVSQDIKTAGEDDFGHFFDLEVPLVNFGETSILGFRFKEGPGVDCIWYEYDRYWDSNKNPREVWVVEGSDTLYHTLQYALQPRLEAAYWDSLNDVTLCFLSPIKPNSLKKQKIKISSGAIIYDIHFDNARKVRLKTSTLSISKCYTVRILDSESVPMYPRRVLDTYTSDLPLGATIEDDNTVFRIFAPRAHSVTLCLSQDPQGEQVEQRDMILRPGDGIWEVILPGNLHGLYYVYSVDGPKGPGEKFNPHIVVNDPYSLIALSSFGACAGRSMVFDPTRLGTPLVLANRPTLSSLVAYEVHIRDLMGNLWSDSDCQPGFNSFCLESVKGPELNGESISVGLDHLVELGVNAVQLLPVQEFPADPEKFNWGYFTANFFSPAGMYASNPLDDTRAFEFKKLVDTLHSKGIAVILDIVFNHTSEGSECEPIVHNFKGLDSKYYYRQHPRSHKYLQGSGVGNELATERPMVRRLIMDCLAFWIDVYEIDGFRFDLAGLIDQETLTAIVMRFPDRILYGEPWAASGALWGKGDANHIRPWAVFNDCFRDTIKGSPDGPEGGFIQGAGELDRVKSAITGNSIDYGTGDAWADSPENSLLYLDAHDNLTLADKLEICWQHHQASISEQFYEEKIKIDIKMPIWEKEQRVKIGAVILLTSLGPVMIHAGTEFLRSKPWFSEGDGCPVSVISGVFDSNSYCSATKTNYLDWQLKARHLELVHYFKGLIKLRLGTIGRIFCSKGRVSEKYFEWYKAPGNPIALGYTLNRDYSRGLQQLRVLVNPSNSCVGDFSEYFRDGRQWRLIADSREVKLSGFENLFTSGNNSVSLVVEPLGIRIFSSVAE